MGGVALRRRVGTSFVSIALAIALLALAIAVAAAPAYAGAASATVDITGLFRFNECTGEPVELEGRVHVLVESNANSRGSFHVRAYTNTMGVSGVGFPSGEAYSLADVGHEVTEFDANGGTTTRTMLIEQFIHRGETLGLVAPEFDDVHVHLDVTVFVDASGVPTVAVRADRRDCR